MPQLALRRKPIMAFKAFARCRHLRQIVGPACFAVQKLDDLLTR
jgi:hypothetical protein